MKMVLDDAAGLNLVAAYNTGKVKIRGQEHNTPAAILPREILNDWPVEQIEDLDSKALRLLVKHRPELLILGTGEQQKFPHPRTFIPLIDAGIGYEVMDNAAACRTYNILLSEDRNVALLLLK